MRQTKHLWVIAVGLVCAAAHGQLVYVKCCFPQNAVRCLGKALCGPERPICFGSDMTGICVYGFGPDIKSIDLAAEMCSPYAVPDGWDVDAICEWWRELPIPITHLCRGRYANHIHTFNVYDYDGDGDVDLEDWARIQNTFQREYMGT